MTEVSQMTDRQITQLIAAYRRRQDAAEGRSRPTRGDEVFLDKPGQVFAPGEVAPGPDEAPALLDGQPLSEEQFLWSLVGAGRLRREDVEKAVAAKEAYWAAKAGGEP